MAINIADIISQYGAYYQPRGQNITNLRNQLFAQKETDTLFNLRITESEIIENAVVNMGAVVQAFQPNFTHMGDADFEPNPITLTRLKVDTEQYPDALVETWLGFLTTNDFSRETWPFIRWFMETCVVPKIADDWEKTAVFLGVKGATTTNTPNPVATAIDGIKQIQNAAITAGSLTPIVMGAVPTDPIAFVEYIEAMCAKTDKLLIGNIASLNMSKTLARLYRQGMKEKYNQYYAQNDLLAVDGYGIPIKGFLSHETSNIIWGTTAINPIMGIKWGQNEGLFKIEEVKRAVSLMSDWFKGIGFGRYDHVMRNDVELPS